MADKAGDPTQHPTFDLSAAINMAHMAGRYEATLFQIGDILRDEPSNSIACDRILKALINGMNRMDFTRHHLTFA